MSITQQRLDAYLAAEARVLRAGLSIRMGERARQEAELETIRRAIVELQQQLARERGGRGGSLSHRTAVFD